MRALDTNVILYHFLSDGKFGGNASEIIEKINKGEEIFIPLPVMKETLFAMIRQGKELSEIIQVLSSLNKDNAIIAEDDFTIFIEGLEIASKYKINATDGVIVSLMQKHGVTEIYSNDPDFDKVPGIKRIEDFE